jgi:hypothetical protein
MNSASNFWQKLKKNKSERRLRQNSKPNSRPKKRQKMQLRRINQKTRKRQNPPKKSIQSES